MKTGDIGYIEDASVLIYENDHCVGITTLEDEVGMCIKEHHAGGMDMIMLVGDRLYGVTPTDVKNIE